MTVYITGPMLDGTGRKLAAFEAAADCVRRYGRTPTHPGEIFLGLGGVLSAIHDYDECAVAEARAEAVLDAEAVVALPGWEDCPQAVADVELARLVGICVYDDLAALAVAA